jgi:hypothetical protein
MSVDFKLDRTKFEVMSFAAADAAMNNLKKFLSS